MVLNIAFTRAKLVKLEQILAQSVTYYDHGRVAVGGLTVDDLETVRDNAANFRSNLSVWLNQWDAYDSTTQDADFSG